MELIKTEPTAAFDTSAITAGNVIWGKHYSWSEGIAGFVTSVTERQIIVQYHPGIGNVTNHYFIPVSEAAAGDWQIRWSADLSEVSEYNITSDDADADSGDDTGTDTDDANTDSTTTEDSTGAEDGTDEAGGAESE